MALVHRLHTATLDPTSNRGHSLSSTLTHSAPHRYSCMGTTPSLSCPPRDSLLRTVCRFVSRVTMALVHRLHKTTLDAPSPLPLSRVLAVFAAATFLPIRIPNHHGIGSRLHKAYSTYRATHRVTGYSSPHISLHILSGNLQSAHLSQHARPPVPTHLCSHVPGSCGPHLVRPRHTPVQVVLHAPPTPTRLDTLSTLGTRLTTLWHTEQLVRPCPHASMPTLSHIHILSSRHPDTELRSETTRGPPTATTPAHALRVRATPTRSGTLPVTPLSPHVPASMSLAPRVHTSICTCFLAT
jgi:hypothetical protein